MAEIKITKDNFKKEVLASDRPVLVDFWATWCGPCRMIAPVISEIAEEYAGEVKVGKINIDEEQELAMKYGVTAIPTVILFRDGKAEGRAVGLQDKKELVKLWR